MRCGLCVHRLYICPCGPLDLFGRLHFLFRFNVPFALGLLFCSRFNQLQVLYTSLVAADTALLVLRILVASSSQSILQSDSAMPTLRIVRYGRYRTLPSAVCPVLIYPSGMALLVR